MKRRLQWTRNLNQVAGSGDIDLAVVCQNAECNSIRAQLLGREHILLHGFKLCFAVAEIAAAWPNHYVNIDGQLPLYVRDQSGARCYAPFHEIAAKLDPMGPTSFRRQG